VIGSFRLASAPRAAPDAGERTTKWTDPTGAFGCDQPVGWVLRGGLATYDNQPVVSLQGTAIDGADAWFAWHQPVRPTFRELTEAMRRLGFRDGDPYYAYDGIDPRMVMTRNSGEVLVSKCLIPEGLLPVGAATRAIDEVGVEGLQIIGQPEERTSLVTLAGSATQADSRGWCLVSQAPLGQSRDGWFWEAAVLAFGGKSGRWAEAARALYGVVRSAAVEAKADGGTRAAVEPLIARARAATGAAAWNQLVGDAAFRPALGAEPSGEGGARVYAVPEGVAEAWQSLARTGLPSYNGNPPAAATAGADGH